MLEAGLRTESPVSDPIAKEMAFVKVAAAPEEEPPTKYSLFLGWKKSYWISQIDLYKTFKRSYQFNFRFI